MKTSCTNIYSEDFILEGLKSNNRKVISYIYTKYFPCIKSLILKNSGIKEDAEDIFQDALIIILNKAKVAELALTSTFGTFIYSICWYLWLQRLYKRKNEHLVLKKETKFFKEAPDTETTFSSNVESDLARILQNQFIKLDSRSQQLLTLFMNGIQHKETAKIMGYHSENYVKTRKYLCKERLKKYVIRDPGYGKLMMEMAEC
jgi:RNA polymerase sigma factor (sigma-70 family)